MRYKPIYIVDNFQSTFFNSLWYLHKLTCFYFKLQSKTNKFDFFGLEILYSSLTIKIGRSLHFQRFLADVLLFKNSNIGSKSVNRENKNKNGDGKFKLYDETKKFEIIDSYFVIETKLKNESKVEVKNHSIVLSCKVVGKLWIIISDSLPPPAAFSTYGSPEGKISKFGMKKGSTSDFFELPEVTGILDKHLFLDFFFLGSSRPIKFEFNIPSEFDLDLLTPIVALSTIRFNSLKLSSSSPFFIAKKLNLRSPFKFLHESLSSIVWGKQFWVREHPGVKKLFWIMSFVENSEKTQRKLDPFRCLKLKSYFLTKIVTPYWNLKRFLFFLVVHKD